MLEFKVIGQYLKRTDETIVIADSENYLYAHFTLPDTFTGVSAHFSVITDGVRNGVSLDVIDSTCQVPNKYIKADKFYLVLTSLIDGIFVPTNEIYVRVNKSGISEGELPDLPDAEPNQYAEFERMYTEWKTSGGSSYILPTASTTVKGGIKIDGTTITINENGVISSIGGTGTGTDGKSAYEIAVDNGFVGTELEWLASLNGEDGAQGIQGIQGLQGLNGNDGTQGIQGEQGIQGIQGTAGTNGTNGTSGITPIKGTDYFTTSEIATIKSDIEADIDAYVTVDSVSNVYPIDIASKSSINIAIATADTTAKTVTVSNVPTRTEMFLELTYTNAAAITWFSGITWLISSAPTLTAGKTYRMSFFTSNSGTLWHGYVAGGV